MSFILDALKKSEAERQRQNAPGIASIPESGGRKSGSTWIWLVVGLLAINLVVVAVLLAKTGYIFTAEEAIPPVAISEAAPEPASFSDLVSEAKRNQPDPVAPEEEPAAPVVEQPAAAPAETVSEGLATFNDLRAQGMLTLPDLHLDIHVYSGEPADRFVFVNMSKYKENATLAEGPVVREITPDGVVLEYLGTGFLLPRE